MMNDEFDYSSVFFAPDSFDRATMDCCYTTAGTSSCLGDIAIDSASNSDLTAFKLYAKGDIGISNEFCSSVDSTVSALDELRERVCALENAAVQVKENVTRPLKNWRWKRADYKTLV